MCIPIYMYIVSTRHCNIKHTMPPGGRCHDRVGSTASGALENRLFWLLMDLKFLVIAFMSSCTFRYQFSILQVLWCYFFKCLCINRPVCV